MVEVARTLRSLNEYGELETVKPGDHAEVFLETTGKLSGEGVY